MPQPLGRVALEVGVAALLAALYAYSWRKWREQSLDRERVFVEEKEAARLEKLTGGVENLQAQVRTGRLTKRPEILAAARDLLRISGLHGLYGVDVVPGGEQGWRIDLGPRGGVLGGLDTWLAVHGVLGALAIPTVLLHSRLHLGGPLTSALLGLFACTALTGLLSGLFRWGGRNAAEIDEVRAQLASIESALADAVPGTGRHQILLAQQSRILLQRGRAAARVRLLDGLRLAHAPLAAAVLGLTLLHLAQSLYY